MGYIYALLGLLGGFFLGRLKREKPAAGETAEDAPERSMQEQWERMMRYDGLDKNGL